MDHLTQLKEALLTGRDTDVLIDACYVDFLENYQASNACVFSNLLRMARNTPRITEILKVIDLVRFPVEKAVATE